MKKIKTTIIFTLIIIVVFFLIIVVSPKEKSQIYLQNRLYIGGLEISNLKTEEALRKIQQACSQIEESGINLMYEEEIINLPAATASFDADLAYLIFYCDQEAIAHSLSDYGQPNLLGRWYNNIFHRRSQIIRPTFFIDKNRAKNFIYSNFNNIEKEPVDASFIFNNESIKINEEQIGKKINWDLTFSEIEERLNYFSSANARIHTDLKMPAIYKDDLIGLEHEAKELSSQEILLKFNNQSWKIDETDIASWLDVIKTKNIISLEFSKNRIQQYLKDSIAPQIDKDPKDHRFEIKDGKVINWQLGKNGYKLNLEDSAKKIMKLYDSNNTDDNNAHLLEVELIVSIIEPADPDSFNIEDILGTGHSNFAGSPANRRHNIKIGSDALHGLIIKPDEEFSLVKALGAINEHTGYLPELVIKGNRTIPEYGGGLCQVATTLFRSALASGLPITARQNHSYRVSYYEPAGTDASIYNPWPDVRFVNDTGNDILIQANIEKDDMYLDFWGIKDGRKVSITEPVIYNIVKPPPTKIVETEDLNPGERKCTERAHDGASAYFDYTVTYAEIDEETGEPIEKYRRFNSYYVPWQEVCLVGKEKEVLSEENEEEDKNKEDEEYEQD